MPRGHGHALTLAGDTVAPAKGRFGGGWDTHVSGKPAVAKNDPALSPGGAFTLEMWLQPDSAPDDEVHQTILLDKKAGDHDYQLSLVSTDDSFSLRGRRARHADPSGRARLRREIFPPTSPGR